MIANKDDFGGWSELKKINKLYEKHADQTQCTKSVLTEIISVRKCYSSTYIFS